jgi:VanZ family protein
MDRRPPSSPSARRRDALAAVVAAGLLLASVVDPGGAGVGAATPGGPLGAFGLDKWAHAAGYATLALAVAFAVAARRSVGPAALGAVVLAVAAYGAGIEVVQATLPARSFDLADMAANATGALLAAAAWVLVGRRRSTGDLIRADDG